MARQQSQLELFNAVPIKQYGIHNFRRVIESLRFSALGLEPLLDLSRITFVRPPLLALLRAYVDLLLKGDDRLRLARKRLVRANPPRSPQARRYLMAMNLFGSSTAPSGETGETLSESQYLPLSVLRRDEESEFVAAKLKSILLKKLPATSDTATIGMALGATLGELLENFKKHSESGRVGWVCAQYYKPAVYKESRARPRRRESAIEIAVADTGIGIARSLAAVPHLRRMIRAGANPCELATQLGVTSKPGEHSGLGLFVARRLAERNGGFFKLASGRYWFKSDNRRAKCGQMSTPWPGTFVALRLSLQRDVDVRKVYDEIQPPEPM